VLNATKNARTIVRRLTAMGEKGKAKPSDEICEQCGEPMQPVLKEIKPVPGMKCLGVYECKKCSIARGIFEQWEAMRRDEE